jgi:hypothetical protein
MTGKMISIYNKEAAVLGVGRADNEFSLDVFYIRGTAGISWKKICTVGNTDLELS